VSVGQSSAFYTQTAKGYFRSAWGLVGCDPMEGGEDLMSASLFAFEGRIVHC